MGLGETLPPSLQMVAEMSLLELDLWHLILNTFAHLSLATLLGWQLYRRGN